MISVFAASLCFVSFLADAPRVVSLEPRNQAADVDFKGVTQLVIEFDRPMDTTGWSLCGGGPEFPKTKGMPRWDGPKKLVVKVELEPEHSYQLMLNCPAASKFRSTEGVTLEPVPWSFSTAPAKLPDPAKQKAQNRKALEELKKLLAEKYSYYDLRVKSWEKIWKEHEPAVLAARTTLGWASEVAVALIAAQDIHLHLKYGDRIFPTATRAVDSLFRSKLLMKYFAIQEIDGGGLWGRSEEGIGYLMIENWSDAKLVEEIEKKLPALRDCKAAVIDVRPNGGGNELLAQRVAAWFVEDSKVYAKNRYRAGAVKNSFGPVYDRVIEGNTEPAKQIRIPLAVLTSRYVVSSNESFVMMLRQAPNCVTVGQPTFGSSGNPKAHALSNEVTIVLPSWQDLRLDGTCLEGEGLTPDVLVQVDPQDLDARDPILESALQILRERIAK